ncbi:MAG TPA: hypothetical protein VE441_12785 [Mycobacterium sp.]|jgi:hypothetical protein|nr:hypothetical protein [Mycobacterium sp.]
MSVAIQGRDPHRRKAEQAALDQLIQRLTQQFPELSQPEIVRAVHGRYGEYSTAGCVISCRCWSNVRHAAT